jgi:hypothetical protein
MPNARTTEQRGRKGLPCTMHLWHINDEIDFISRARDAELA